MDFYADKKTLWVLYFQALLIPRTNNGDNTTYLKDGNGIVDSIVYATNSSKGTIKEFGSEF